MTCSKLWQLLNADVTVQFSAILIPSIHTKFSFSRNALFMIETAVGNSEFELHSAFGEPGLNIYRCPIRVRTGESYQVRISGSGKVVIYEIEIRKSDGGRRYKEY